MGVHRRDRRVVITEELPTEELEIYMEIFIFDNPGSCLNQATGTR